MNLLKELHKFTSTDQARKRLWGILHDAENQVLVATDAKQMVVIPHKVTGKTRVIDYLTGEEIAYPASLNWKMAVPKDAKYLGFGKKHLLKKAKEAARIEEIKRGNGYEYVALLINGNYYIPKQIVKGIELLQETAPCSRLRCLGPDHDRAPLLIKVDLNHFYLTMPLGRDCVGHNHEIIEV